MATRGYSDTSALQISAAAVDFGSIYQSGTFSGLGTITVRAPAGVSLVIALDGGLHSLGGSRSLERRDGTETIPYGLYMDAPCTVPWGDADLSGSFPAGMSSRVTGTGNTQILPVYGRVMVGAALPPGEYQDSVTITVEY